MADDQSAPVYVSPDGSSEMRVTSPATRINLEHRGWKPKGDVPLATTSPQPMGQTDDTPKSKQRRQAADE
jgi:hypothetical protein